MIRRRDALIGATIAALAGKGSQAVSRENSGLQEANGTDLRLRYGTNRKKVPGSDLFNGEYEWSANDKRYHAGIIDLEKIGGQWRPKPSPSARSRSERGLTAEDNPRAVIRGFLNSASDTRRAFSEGEQTNSLVFIHGYAFNFTEVFDVAGVIAEGYGSANNLFFSWPSYGQHLKYLQDRDHAYGSGVAVAQFLKDLFDEIDTMGRSPRISLVCHSMGNRVMSATIQALKDRGKMPSKTYFEHILLFAADEDYKALNEEGKLKPVIGMFKKNLHVYTNGDDFALAFGQSANNGIEELGKYGPRSFPIRNNAGEIQKDIFWINCQRVADPTIPTLGHQYFRLSPEVINDARQVISGKDPSSISGRYVENGFWGQKFSIKKI